LERKFTISQAYSDALRQAYGKCQDGGSHEETASAVTSADYAQVSSSLTDESSVVDCGRCLLSET